MQADDFFDPSLLNLGDGDLDQGTGSAFHDELAELMKGRQNDGHDAGEGEEENDSEEEEEEEEEEEGEGELEGEDEDDRADGAERKAKRKRPQESLSKAFKYMKQFPGHFDVKMDKDMGRERLYCKHCKCFVASSSVRGIRQHIYGQGVTNALIEKVERGDAGVKLTRHMQAFQLANKPKPEKSMSDFFKPTSTLPKAVVERRGRIAMALLATGTPFRVLDHPFMRDVFEENSEGQITRAGVAAMTETAFAAHVSELRKLVDGRKVTILFDGSTILYPLEATLVRFVSNGEILTRVIKVKRVDSSLNAEDLGTILNQSLQRMHIPLANVVFGAGDRGSINKNALEKLMGRMEVREKDVNIKFLPCLAHTLDNAGKQLQKTFEVTSRFLAAWNQLRKSPNAKKLWFALTKSQLPRFAATRWWSWHECATKILQNWNALDKFVNSLIGAKVAAASTTSLDEILTGDGGRPRAELRLQLFAVSVTAEIFWKAGKLVQSNKFIAPFVFEVLQGVQHSVDFWNGAHGTQELTFMYDTIVKEVERFPRHKPPGDASWIGDHQFHTAFVARVKKGIDLMHGYFKGVLWNANSELVETKRLFEAVRVFCPHFLLAKLENVPAESLSGWNFVKELKGVHGFSNDLLTSLSAQFPKLVFSVRAWCANNKKATKMDQRMDQAWSFWNSLRGDKDLAAWTAAADLVALMIPSSADVERFFSVAQGKTKKTQKHLLEDNEEARLMIAYNSGAYTADLAALDE